jgi:hypothetical protein
MSDALIDIPCVSLPKVPVKMPKIELPFGVELQAIMDISKGPPTDCTLVHSLMLQLAPVLAGMTCFFKVLKVMVALKDISVDSLPKIAQAAADLADCFLVFDKIPKLIGDILRILIMFLKCFIQAVESIINFQVGIDLNAADGNPALLFSLQCAQDNAQTSLAQLMAALEAIQPLLDMMQPLMQMGGLSLKLPSMADVTGAKDLTEMLHKIEATLEEMQQLLDSLPI